MNTTVALNLDSFTEDGLISEARRLAGSITEFSADLPPPKPTAAQIDAAADAAEKGITDCGAAQLAAIAATENKNNLLAALRQVMNDSAAWGEHEIKEASLLMKLFTLKKSRTPTTSVPQVQSIAITFGDNSGEVDLVWEPEPLAKSYEIQCRYAGANGTWTHAKIVTASKATLEQLTTAQTVQVRIRAIGPRGLVSPWSDPAEHMVP